MKTGTIDEVMIEGGEAGWHLVIYIHDAPAGDDLHRFRIGLPDQFKAEVDRTIGAWLAEGEAVRASMPAGIGTEAADTGYAFDDPKHPTYHDRMSDAADFGELD